MKQRYYASRAVRSFSAADLDDLLAKARANNLALGLTGLLVYSNGTFMQVVEGPAEAVDGMFRRIAGDPRHELLMEANRVIRERSFPEWQMGYVRLDAATASALPGYSAFFEPDFEPATLPAIDPTFRRLLDGLRAAMVASPPPAPIRTLLGLRPAQPSGGG
ncbi:MAG: BLUF domain-containing protein [Gammaproteobacteria bacterium]